MNAPSTTSIPTPLDNDEQLFNQQQELLRNAIIDNDIDFVKSFLTNSSTSSLLSQFKYSPHDIIPLEPHQLVSPLIFAIIHNKLLIVQLLLYHQYQIPLPHDQIHHYPPNQSNNILPSNQFNPQLYTENEFKLFHYAVASGAPLMMDYILSLYSLPTVNQSPTQLIDQTTSQTTTTTTTTTTQQLIDVDSIISDDGYNSLHIATALLRLEHVKYLIDHYKCDPLALDKNGQTILHFVPVPKKQDQIVLFDYLMTVPGVAGIIEQGDLYGVTPLAIGVLHAKLTLIPHLISKYNVDINTVTDSGDNLLLFAIAHNETDAILNVIDEIIQLNPNFLHGVNNDGFSPLLYAVHFSRLNVVQHLLTHYGADPFSTIVNDTENVLHAAARDENDSYEMFDYLMTLDGISDLLEVKDSEAYTPLCVATFSANRKIIHHLITHYNANMNVIADENGSLLHIAITTDVTSLDFIDYIININPDFLHSETTLGESPLVIAIHLYKLDIMKHLITKYNADIYHINQHTGSTLLHYVAKTAKDCVEVFEYLLSLPNMCDFLHHRDKDGNIPLQWCAINNKPNSFKYLIEQWNVDINTRNDEGSTVAHVFSDRGNVDMIDYIYNKSPQLIYQLNNTNVPPFFKALSQNQIKLAKHFVDKYNVDIHQVDIDDDSMLHFAIQHPLLSCEIVDYILSLKPELLHTTTSNGSSPFQLAIASNNTPLVQHLYTKYNADPLFINPIYKATSLHYIAESIHNDVEDMLEYLMTLPGMIDYLEYQDRDGYTPLLYVASFNKSLAFELFVDIYGADMYCTNQSGFTPARYFVQANNIDMIHFIGQREPELLDQCDNLGYSPLLSAIYHNYLPLVQCLIEDYHVDIEVLSLRDESIFDIAIQGNSTEVLEYLSQLDVSLYDLNIFHACKDGHMYLIQQLMKHYKPKTITTTTALIGDGRGNTTPNCTSLINNSNNNHNNNKNNNMNDIKIRSNGTTTSLKKTITSSSSSGHLKCDTNRSDVQCTNKQHSTIVDNGSTSPLRYAVHQFKLELFKNNITNNNTNRHIQQ